MPGTRRPAYHLTPPAHWMNDPQRPLFREGRWHLYYLYNADFPHGNGTAWARAVSADMVIWRTAGVAIPKYVDEWGDIESGSVVVDEQGGRRTGRGRSGRVRHPAGRRRAAPVPVRVPRRRTDLRPRAGNPVLDNPGTTDFRDPKVIFDAAGERWVMVLAEGPRLGFYASTDLREWTTSPTSRPATSACWSVRTCSRCVSTEIPTDGSGCCWRPRTERHRVARPARSTGPGPGPTTPSSPTSTRPDGWTPGLTTTQRSPGRIRASRRMRSSPADTPWDG